MPKRYDTCKFSLSLFLTPWVTFTVQCQHHGTMGDSNVNKHIHKNRGLYIHENGLWFFLSSLISGKSNNSDITQENFQAHLGGDREN